MKPTDYLLMLVKAYNPNQYERLLERPNKDFLTFLLITLLLSLAIFTIILIPLTVHYVTTIPERISPVEQLQFNAEVKADKPVTLLERPVIILDLGTNQTSKGEFTLTNEGIIYPNMLFGSDIIKWSDIRDIKQQTPTRDRVIGGVILFLLPSIIFWFFLWSILKLFVMCLILIILGYYAPMLFKHRITFSQSTKVAILALPSVIIMDFALYPLATTALTWWGIGLSTAFFIIGIAIMSEVHIADERPRHPKHERA